MTAQTDCDKKPSLAGKPTLQMYLRALTADDRIIELAAKMTQLTEELKKLSEKPICPTEVAGTRGIPAESPPVQQQKGVATALVAKRPRPLTTQV